METWRSEEVMRNVKPSQKTATERRRRFENGTTKETEQTQRRFIRAAARESVEDTESAHVVMNGHPLGSFVSIKQTVLPEVEFSRFTSLMPLKGIIIQT